MENAVELTSACGLGGLRHERLSFSWPVGGSQRQSQSLSQSLKGKYLQRPLGQKRRASSIRERYCKSYEPYQAHAVDIHSPISSVHPFLCWHVRRRVGGEGSEGKKRKERRSRETLELRSRSVSGRLKRSRRTNEEWRVMHSTPCMEKKLEYHA